jgi:hypothetical protein
VQEFKSFNMAPPHTFFGKGKGRAVMPEPSPIQRALMNQARSRSKRSSLRRNHTEGNILRRVQHGRIAKASPQKKKEIDVCFTSEGQSVIKNFEALDKEHQDRILKDMQPGPD